MGEVDEDEVVLPLEPAPEEAGGGSETGDAEAEEEAEVPRRARDPSEPTVEER